MQTKDPSELTKLAESIAVADKGLGSFMPFIEQAATIEGDAAKLGWLEHTKITYLLFKKTLLKQH